MTKPNAEPAGGFLNPAWVTGFDLLACVAGFALGLWFHGLFINPYFSASHAERIREVAVSALIAWSALASSAADGWRGGLRIWIDRLFAAAGFNLVIQYGLAYVVHLRPTPWPATISGIIITILMMAALRTVAIHRPTELRPPTLVLGYDSVAECLIPALGERVAAVFDEHPERIDSGSISPSATVVGDYSRFEEVVSTAGPRRIVVNRPTGRAGVAPRRLLALRYAGVVLEDAPTLFEKSFQRVCWQRREPLDLLLSPDLRINRPAVALQAIYTNVIGLAFLVLLCPLLLVITIVVALTAGGAPLTSYECPGFHRIPFRPLRFRTRRRDGKLTGFGRLLKKFRLVNLPQLINVVRGEMALFGPPPVRKDFADRLAELLPVYSHRFIIKPGMMGWSQVNLVEGHGPLDESLRLEYDLYYVREESPSLDLDILFRTLFRSPVQLGDAGQ
jgi:lipopolysaccharide/colanic/teichoic acid biosynthesis glycosyltransferase